MAAYNKHEYRRAGHEKFRAASAAHVAGHYAVSHYLAGVAVECMLRAFRFAIDPSWDKRHDLLALMKRSGVLGRLPAADQPSVRDAIGEIARRWAIHHRYAPEDRLAASLQRILPIQGRSFLLRNSETMITMHRTLPRQV